MKKKKSVSVFTIITAISLVAILSAIQQSCGRKNRQAEEEERASAGRPENYQENDTLSFVLPENLSLWINYYQQFDTAFRLRNFMASGVSVHLDSMEDAATGDLTLLENFFPLFAFSPDSSQIIDIWSYNQLIEINESGERTVIGGDPDQEIVWINKLTGSKKQAMFNGPQQIVETADWINNESFLLGMINVNEANTTWTPEILLFNMADSTFTNFRMNTNMSIDKMVAAGSDFSGFWLKRKKYKRG